jgi:hypothetical protein
MAFDPTVLTRLQTIRTELLALREEFQALHREASAALTQGDRTRALSIAKRECDLLDEFVKLINGALRRSFAPTHGEQRLQAAGVICQPASGGLKKTSKSNSSRVRIPI